MSCARWLIPMLITFLLAGCRTPDPPELTATAGEAKVPVRLAQYCWEGQTDQRICADPPAPAHLYAELKGATVEPSAALKLSFALKPETLVYQAWRPDFTREEAQEVRQNAITLPGKPGIYTYSVSGTWKQGDASYVIQVEVK